MCMQHTGLRPVTHHTTPCCRIGWLYTHPTNWNMWDHVSICQWCPPNLVDRQLFQPTDHIQYKVLVHWVGIKPMTQDSQSQTQATWPVAVHGITVEEWYQKEWEAICMYVICIYKSQLILAPRYPTIECIPLLDRLQNGTYWLKKWLDKVRHQITMTEVLQKGRDG